MSNRSGLSVRSSTSSVARNLINVRPPPARRSPMIEAEITLAPPARTSGIQEHTGVSTRNTRAQTAEPHSQLQPQTRQYYKSDNKEYRQGQRKRANDIQKGTERHLVEVLNPDNPYNQGYFGDSLSQLYSLGGVQPRQVKQGRPTSMLSQAETPGPKLRLPKKKLIINTKKYLYLIYIYSNVASF